MIHYGDITKINGASVPPVDVIVGGSPCQDLSIAGLRKGLDGERSGLFMEQLRIIKEMREKDARDGRAAHDVRPRYMVWENVPGAFSSNKGEDFRIVLEETAKVADKNAYVPAPDKWRNAGCIMGDGWSIAWRVLDAQFWGVPQRRRRIALVADFGGQSAPEILFVRKGVSGNFEPSESQRKETTRNTSASFGAYDRFGADLYNAAIIGDRVATLGVNCGMSHGRQCILEKENKAYTLKIRSGCEGGEKGALIQTEKSATLSTLQDQTLFQPVGVATYDARGNGNGKTVCTLTGDHENRITDYSSVVVCVDQGGGKSQCNVTEGKTPTLTCTHGGEPVVVYQDSVVALDRAAFNQGKNAQFDIGVDEQGIEQSLVARGPGAVCYNIGAYDSNAWKSNNPHSVRYIVRRLTPMECERLQGYPDGWTLIGEPTEKIVEEFDEDTGEKEGEHIEQTFFYTNSQGKRVKASDAARYKALGNSIALPPWKWVMKRISACYERDATLASLFDGIGGFPYIWEQINGKGSCLWASEIEEFCIAVTKQRIN